MNLKPRTASALDVRCSMLDVRCSPTRAFTLIECLVYMAVLFIVIGVGYVAMYKSMDSSAGFRRNATDISQTLKAGEHWREDIRNASGPIHVENAGENQIVLHIPQPQAEVDYQFSSNNVSRRVVGRDWTPVLEHVKNSSFIADHRQTVACWRWEIELVTYSKSPSKTRPLFTFIAVPSAHTP